MAMILLRCPQCGNEMKIDETKEFCFCDECGKKITVAKSAVPGPGTPAKEAPAAPAEPQPAETEPAPVEAEPAVTAAEETPAVTEVSEETAPAEEVAEEAPEAPEEEVAEEAPEAPEEEVPEAPEEEAAPAGPEPAAAPVVPVPKPTGFAAQLDQLFRQRRFEEAYEGYTRYLQAHPGDIRSLYRQGLCAVYLSEGNLIRTAELKSAVGAAVNAMANTEDHSLAPEKDEELNEMLVYMTAHGVTFNDKLAGREACASQATGWVALAGLYQIAVPFITAEARREEALRAGVEFCDRALRFKSSYFSGSAHAADGKTKEEYSDYSLDKKQRAAIKDARIHLAESFNSLTSRTAEEARLNSDAAETEKAITRLRADIRRTEEKFRASRKVFLLDKPEIKAGRGKILRNSLIIGGIVVLGLAAFGFFALRKDKTFLFVLLMLLMAAFLYLTFRVSRKSLREYEATQYPPELKELYDRLTESNKQLRTNRKHAAAAKDAVKKFNSSKL